MNQKQEKTMNQYKAWPEVPDHLKTKTQLSQMGLKPAKDQKPAALKRGWKWYNDYDLYDLTQAVPKRKMSEAQAAALAEARRKAMTTTCCNRYVGVINWREQGNMCLSCWVAYQEEQTMAYIQEAKKEASEWARAMLADPGAVILDTETTGLEGEIVEVSIIKMDGTPLLDTLVKPTRPIPADATAIHGITNEMVQDAPGWAVVYPVVKEILEAASRVVIYNASFDEGRLRADCWRHDLDVLKFKANCAMEAYARWYGEWDSYHGSFRWQRLTGGHRALGDCQACLRRIQRMAESGGDDDNNSTD